MFTLRVNQYEVNQYERGRAVYRVGCPQRSLEPSIITNATGTGNGHTSIVGSRNPEHYRRAQGMLSIRATNPAPITLMMEKLMRPTHLKMVAGMALLVGVTLVAVINLQVPDEQTAPPTLTPSTVVPALPAQGGVVPLEPEPMATPNQPKAHAATSSTPHKRAPAVGGNEDWMTGQRQRQMATQMCGSFGISC
jgi:hypothetical protein